MNEILMKSKKLSKEQIVEFIDKELDDNQKNKLLNMEEFIHDSIDFYDEYVSTILPYCGYEAKEYTLLNTVDNEYFPSDKISCIISPNLKDYFKDNMYAVTIPNGKIEVRYRLPEKIDVLRVNSENLGIEKNKVVTHRQQVLLEILDSKKDNCIFVLRGYGQKEFNSYAVSLYNPEKNIMFVTPTYKEILELYKKSISKNEKFKNIVEKIISQGMHPLNLKIWRGEIILYDDNYLKEDIYILYLLYYLVKSEDKGIFSREYIQVAIECINKGMNVEEALNKQNSLKDSFYENFNQKAENKINDMIETYTYLMNEFYDGDGWKSTLKYELTLLDSNFIKNIYVNCCMKNKERYDYSLTRSDMIKNIIDIIFKYVKIE